MGGDTAEPGLFIPTHLVKTIEDVKIKLKVDAASCMFPWDAVV